MAVVVIVVEPKLLIVDDEPIICKTLADIFHDRGYSATTATTGRDALNKIKQTAFNAALIDINLPDIDGTMLLKKLRTGYPEMVCIIITGYATVQNAIDALDEGVSGYFVKPLVIEEVIRRVDEALDKQRLQRKLKESEERLSSFMDSATDGFALYDSGLNLVEMNETALAMLPPGTTKEAFIGKNILAVLPDLKETNKYDQYLKVLKTGEPLFVDDLVFHHKFGDRHLAVKAFKVGEGLGIITTDITEQKQAEKALKESERRLTDIINFLPDATFAIDREGKVIAWNRAIEEMTGIRCRDMLGKGDYEYALPFYGIRRPVLVNLVLTPDKELEKKYSVITREGDCIIAEVTTSLRGQEVYLWGKASLIYDHSGAVVGAIESIRDITERKRTGEAQERLLQELEAKNAEMERFVYTISHELKSPLVTVQGFTEMLRNDVERNDVKEMETDLRVIGDAVTAMGNFMNDTLELSRIGRVANPPEEVPFDEIVQKALEQTEERIISCEAEVSVAEDFPTVYVDRMRVVEVLVNLIENSIKYGGEESTPKIEIGHRLDGKETVFFVQDNGIGIEKSQHEKVFELFNKVDKSSKGTGAGLAIVKRIIEVHGGRIWIESELGQGCTVCFTLPAA